MDSYFGKMFASARPLYQPLGWGGGGNRPVYYVVYRYFVLFVQRGDGGGVIFPLLGFVRLGILNPSPPFSIFSHDSAAAMFGLAVPLSWTPQSISPLSLRLMFFLPSNTCTLDCHHNLSFGPSSPLMLVLVSALAH